MQQKQQQHDTQHIGFNSIPQILEGKVLNLFSSTIWHILFSFISLKCTEPAVNPTECQERLVNKHSVFLNTFDRKVYENSTFGRYYKCTILSNFIDLSSMHTFKCSFKYSIQLWQYPSILQELILNTYLTFEIVTLKR